MQSQQFLLLLAVAVRCLLWATTGTFEHACGFHCVYNNTCYVPSLRAIKLTSSFKSWRAIQLYRHDTAPTQGIWHMSNKSTAN